jgi:phage terminase small subunit
LRQEQFVREYLLDLNATQAAIRAGYSPRTANERAAKLMRRPWIRDAIAQEIAQRSRRTGISADRVLEELAVIAFADLGELVQFGPGGIRIQDTEGLDTRALAEVTERTNRQGATITFKLLDKVAALTKLAQHLGLLVEKHEHTGPGGGPIAMRLEGLTPEERASLIRRAAGRLEAGDSSASGR